MIVTITVRVDIMMITADVAIMTADTMDTNHIVIPTITTTDSRTSEATKHL